MLRAFVPLAEAPLPFLVFHSEDAEREELRRMAAAHAAVREAEMLHPAVLVDDVSMMCLLQSATATCGGLSRTSGAPANLWPCRGSSEEEQGAAGRTGRGELSKVVGRS